MPQCRTRHLGRLLSTLSFMVASACAGDRPKFGQSSNSAQDETADASASGSGMNGDGAVTSSITVQPVASSGQQGGDVSPAETEPAVECEGCLIDGRCYSADEVSAQNECLVCDPLLSTTEWSSDDGKACSDDRYCTVIDSCSAGECIGEARICDDGIACNGVESCDEVASQCIGAASTCADDEFCNSETDTCSTDCSGCVIDGNCYADGSSSPTNACLVCDKATASDEWSVDVGANCDDDDLCTEDDTCDITGRCGGMEVVCNDDDDECGAARSCDSGTGTCVEQYPGSSISCSDGDSCTTNDRCDGAGECVGTPSTGATAGCDCIDDSDCDDGIACTTDTCREGQCAAQVASGSCLIRGKCYDQDTPDPSNPCRYCDAASANTSWSDSPSSVACDDGIWCNGDDMCDGSGSCSHAHPNGNRCADRTGACEVQSCDESAKHCFAPAGTVCDEDERSGCMMGDSCSADVYTWPVQYTCSGESPTCGTTPNEREDLATVMTMCGDAEACHTASGTCRPALGCDTSYCKSGLCWTKENAPMQYAQDPARGYCGSLELAGRTDWRLPTVAEMETLLESQPSEGCYWPSEMGACDELWTTDGSASFAFWVGTSALQISSVPLDVRCVVTE